MSWIREVTARRSSSEREYPSPVVPQATIPCTPAASIVFVVFDVNADEGHALTFEGPRGLGEFGHLRATRRTPGSPAVHHGDVSTRVSEREGFPIQICPGNVQGRATVGIVHDGQSDLWIRGQRSRRWWSECFFIGGEHRAPGTKGHCSHHDDRGGKDYRASHACSLSRSVDAGLDRVRQRSSVRLRAGGSVRLNRVGGDVAEAPGLEVFERLDDLGFRAHHERSVLKCRLPQRHTTDDEHLQVR